MRFRRGGSVRNMSGILGYHDIKNLCKNMVRSFEIVCAIGEPAFLSIQKACTAILL